MLNYPPLAVIFDMDGTMVDNMSVHNECWQKTLAKYGLDLSIAEVKAVCHGKNIDIIQRLFGDRYSADEGKAIADEKEQMYRDIFVPQLQLVDGLQALLEYLYQMGIPMGIGTAAPPENVQYVLDHLHIRHFFKVVIDAEQVQNGKPNPEVFWKVADRLGEPYNRCLVFEDSPTGAKTALHAGMKSVIITTTHSEEEFVEIPSVLRCIPDFNAVQWDQFFQPG